MSSYLLPQLFLIIVYFLPGQGQNGAVCLSSYTFLKVNMHLGDVGHYLLGGNLAANLLSSDSAGGDHYMVKQMPCYVY